MNNFNVTRGGTHINHRTLNDYVPISAKSRRMSGTGHAVLVGERRGAYRILVGRPEGRRPLERPRGRWKDSIKMDLQEVG
jgi:hypothetical protein